MPIGQPRGITAHGVTLRFDARTCAGLVEAARSSPTGVRHLRALLERDVLAPLSNELLGRDATSLAKAIDVSRDADDRVQLAWSVR